MKTKILLFAIIINISCGCSVKIKHNVPFAELKSNVINNFCIEPDQKPIALNSIILIKNVKKKPIELSEAFKVFSYKIIDLEDITSKSFSFKCINIILALKTELISNC